MANEYDTILDSTWNIGGVQNVLLKMRDFPGGSGVKNPPCNVGDMGSIPGGGTEIPRAMGPLSLHATTGPSHHNKGSRVMQQRSYRLELRPSAAK